nr:zinc finger, CCHC-type, retrotransposon Gag domain protein [Tanacetum cinerariifolium]
HQPTTQQSSHRNHGHNNVRHGSDRRGGGDNHYSSNNNYSGNNNRNSGNGRDQRNRGQQSGTEEEQAKNFQWGLRRSTLNHLMCMSYTDVAQVANAARNYEILHERDDDDTERGGSDNHRSSNNNYSGSNNRNSGYGHDQRNRGHQSNRSAISGSQQSRVPLRATPIQFALLVDADTHESVVELLILTSRVVKLAIYRKIARRTPLRVHLVRLIRS